MPSANFQFPAMPTRQVPEPRPSACTASRICQTGATHLIGVQNKEDTRHNFKKIDGLVHGIAGVR